MTHDVSKDRLAVIRVEGLHCHKCEAAIRSALVREPGVHEVEVDFLSGQASVLFDSERINVRQIMDGIGAAGYRAVSFTLNQQGQVPHS